MSYIKNLFKSSRARVTLVLVIIGIAAVASFFLPKEPDPNIGLTKDTVVPTVGVTNPVATLTVNRSSDFRDVHLTVTHVEEAGAFSDDRKRMGTYTIRVHVHVQAGDNVRAPLGIDYSSLVHLVLPDGRQVSPKLINLPPVVFPKQANDGFFDFPVTSRTPLEPLTLNMGDGTMVAFS
ncbi:MAG: hypothetical protein ACJ788_03400 [Ktedonobacteraceae bacterium]|jgi:4-amino-4-deoxy-L-arabinose transferase-like glycosyltransferase